MGTLQDRTQIELANIEAEVDRLSGGFTIKSNCEKAKRYGQLLARAKELLPHGQWHKWLKLRGVSPRTAQVWVQVSRALQQPNTQYSACLTIGDVLKLLHRGREMDFDERRLALAKLDTGRTPRDITLIHGHFTELQNHIRPNSVQLAVIDPPYAELSLYGESAKLAKGFLKDGGVALVYASKSGIPHVINQVSPYLRYVSCFCAYYGFKGGGSNKTKTSLYLYSRWTPILVFQKGKSQLISRINDGYHASPRQDYLHKWQQCREALTYWIKRLTNPRQIVVDFFCGSGTTPLICQELSRICYSADIDGTCIKAARALLKQEKTRMPKVPC
jgi:16S rRNA G966 N2-methylase RsmD